MIGFKLMTQDEFRIIREAIQEVAIEEGVQDLLMMMVSE